jgi:hypothetical protein
MTTQTYYHVTHKDHVEPILSSGFEGGWGDAGFGVYFFDDLAAAEDYASKGGWDGNSVPEDLQIIEVEDDIHIEHVIPNPAWPNPEDYENVCYSQMDENEPPWGPVRRLLDPSTPEP